MPRKLKPTDHSFRNVFNGVSSRLLPMVIFALLISSVVPATIRKSSNYARLADIDRHLRDGDKRCPNDRPFVCYVFDELHQEYPAWLKQRGDDSDEDETKCAPCDIAGVAECREGKAFSADAADGTRLKGEKCRPKFCKPGAPEAADCIAPIKINENKETLFLPFNLCTREMVASGQCEGKNLSGINYSPESIPHTTQYFLQCDAGFVIPQWMNLVVNPKSVLAAHAVDRTIKETCIPSLQLAAGYLQSDQAGFDKDPYDVLDPLQPNYCPKGGRQAGQKCDPLHLCMSDPTAIKFYPGEGNVIKTATKCDEQCLFPRPDGQYLPESCVLLDITDQKGSPPYYTLRRALVNIPIIFFEFSELRSGPYASLMSEEETIELLETLRAKKQVSERPPEQPVVPSSNPSDETSGVEENPQRHHGGRMKRQGSSLPSVSYPRCIKTDGLPEDQKAIVKADGLLDCEQNPFYKELGLKSLTVTKLPLCSGVDSNKKFCRTSADSQSTNPTATTPDSEGDWLDPPEPWALVSMVLACSGDALMVIAIALAWYIRFRRPEKDDDDDDDEEMDSHSRKHDSSKKKSGDDDDA